MHLDKPVLKAEELDEPRTIIRKYTQTNPTNVALPDPIDTKKAMLESV